MQGTKQNELPSMVEVKQPCYELQPKLLLQDTLNVAKFNVTVYTLEILYIKTIYKVTSSGKNIIFFLNQRWFFLRSTITIISLQTTA